MDKINFFLYQDLRGSGAQVHRKHWNPSTQFPGSGGSVPHPSQHTLTAHTLPVTHAHTHTQTPVRQLERSWCVSESEKVDRKSSTQGPFQASVVLLQGPPVITSGQWQSKVSAKPASNHKHDLKDQLSRQNWTLSKRAALYLQSLAKSKIQNCEIPFIANTKKEEKLWPIKPLQKTLADFNLLMLSSLFLFFLSSLTWSKMTCIFCANTAEPHHVFLAFHDAGTTRAITESFSVTQILTTISFSPITPLFYHPVC